MLPIYLFGNPVLRKKALPVTENAAELSPLIQEMFDTMYQAEGVGLAAPQIGKSLQLFVIDTAPFKEMYPEVTIKKSAFINPIIEEKYGDDFIFNEGCLSLPDIHEDISRKSEILISYTDENGNFHQSEHFDGLVARVIQHEYDHLDGLVFTDHVSSLKKMILKKKLNEISSGKHKPNYRSKI